MGSTLPYVTNALPHLSHFSSFAVAAAAEIKKNNCLVIGWGEIEAIERIGDFQSFTCWCCFFFCFFLFVIDALSILIDKIERVRTSAVK